MLTTCGLAATGTLLTFEGVGVVDMVPVDVSFDVGPIRLQVAANNASGEGVGLDSCKKRNELWSN